MRKKKKRKEKQRSNPNYELYGRVSRYGVLPV